jgi:hypothetical protein
MSRPARAGALRELLGPSCENERAFRITKIGRPRVFSSAGPPMCPEVALRGQYVRR